MRFQRADEEAAAVEPDDRDDRPAFKALVTGGAGFIGSNLVRALLARGDDVRVLDNFSTGYRQNLDSLDVDLVEGDLRSYERVAAAVNGVEVVFHQGALPSVPRSIQDPLTSSAVNVEGTLNVLLAARDAGVRRVVFASSSSVYGDAPGMPRRESQALAPLAPYAVSKLAAEQYCMVANRVFGLETVALRYFNVFGEHQDPCPATRPSYRSSSGPCSTASGRRSSATARRRATSRTSRTSSRRTSRRRRSRPLPAG